MGEKKTPYLPKNVNMLILPNNIQKLGQKNTRYLPNSTEIYMPYNSAPLGYNEISYVPPTVTLLTLISNKSSLGYKNYSYQYRSKHHFIAILNFLPIIKKC